MFAPSQLVKEVFVDWEKDMEEHEEEDVQVISQTLSVDSDDEYDNENTM